MKLYDLFLAILCQCQHFVQRRLKSVKTLNACSLFAQFWDSIFYLFEYRKSQEYRIRFFN